MKISTQHFAVPADLQPYVDSFWYVECNGTEAQISPHQYCLATGLVELILFAHRYLEMVGYRQ